MITSRASEQLIFDAAHAFDDLEYRATSLSEIATKMGLPVEDLSSKFASVEELSYAVIDAQHALSRRAGEKILARTLPAIETMISITATFAQDLIDNTLVRAGVLLNSDVRMSDSLRAAWRDWEQLMSQLLAKGMKEGDVEADLDISVTARSINSFFFGMQYLSWMNTKYGDLMDALFEMWIVLIKSSVRKEKQAQLFGTAYEIIMKQE